MYKITLFFIGICLYGFTAGQTNYAYEETVARAGLFHLQKNYKEAIPLFEKAFQIQQPDALNAYKAAGVYVLDSNIDRAFFYLDLALKLGWRETEALNTDPYFDYLRAAASQRWMQLIHSATVLEQRYARSLKLPGLRKRINDLGLRDQRLRYARIQAHDQAEMQRIDHQLLLSDSANLAQAKIIIRTYGWPKISEVGKDGQNNLWLIVQHADNDVFFQKAVLSAMRKLDGTHELNTENYAFLYDRVQCNLNYKQLYGTQVNWTAKGEATGFRSILDENKVDERRHALGLLRLKIYALTYGFQYSPVSAEEAAAEARSDSLYVKRLIDSAKYWYTHNDFQKVYDQYNTASTFLSGMSNSDNFEAALLFARIAIRDHNDRYRSISLDFLNLLLQRGELTKKALNRHRPFQVLQEEPRWTAIYSHLSR